MNLIRQWLAALLIWLFFFYNIERISEPINIATFVYVFIIACAIAILLIRKITHVRLYWLFFISIFPYLFLKWWFHYGILGSHLPITVTEICAIGLTILITGQVVRLINEMGEAVSSLTINELLKGSYPFESGQSQIYREIRRARQRQHSTSLLSVSVSKQSLKANLNRFIHDFEQEIVKRYVYARVGNLLLEGLKNTDIVVQRNDHFVILLPETGKPDSISVINRLKFKASKDLGITLKIGAASFPEEATTFELLLETAEGNMDEVLVENEAQPVTLEPASKEAQPVAQEPESNEAL